MNPKYQKVLSDIEKAEKKKSEIEGQLKELYDIQLTFRSFFPASTQNQPG